MEFFFFKKKEERKGEKEAGRKRALRGNGGRKRGKSHDLSAFVIYPLSIHRSSNHIHYSQGLLTFYLFYSYHNLEGTIFLSKEISTQQLNDLPRLIQQNMSNPSSEQSQEGLFCMWSETHAFCLEFLCPHITAQVTHYMEWFRESLSEGRSMDLITPIGPRPHDGFLVVLKKHSGPPGKQSPMCRKSGLGFASCHWSVAYVGKGHKKKGTDVRWWPVFLRDLDAQPVALTWTMRMSHQVQSTEFWI